MTIDFFELMATVVRAEVHTFIGRLGGDPKVRSFESGSCVASASMAVDWPDKRRDDDSAPDWFDVQLWGEEGLAFADSYHKGDVVRVEGRVKLERWTDRATGEEKAKWVIKASAISKLRPATPRGEDGAPPAAAAAADPPAPAPAAAPAQWSPPPAAASARPSPF